MGATTATQRRPWQCQAHARPCSWQAAARPNHPSRHAGAAHPLQTQPRIYARKRTHRLQAQSQLCFSPSTMHSLVRVSPYTMHSLVRVQHSQPCEGPALTVCCHVSCPWNAATVPVYQALSSAHHTLMGHPSRNAGSTATAASHLCACALVYVDMLCVCKQCLCKVFMRVCARARVHMHTRMHTSINSCAD